MIGCSINATEEGLAAMQEYVKRMGSTYPAGQEQRVAAIAMQGLTQALGMQRVTVKGVPATTHFAQVLVEADYRMKLIGIGLEEPPVRLVSFINTVKPAPDGPQRLVRWFFTPDYECVRTSEDGLAMETVGDGVKLVGEDELVSGQGERTRRPGDRRQPGVCPQFHPTVSGLGQPLAGLCRTAEPDRPVRAAAAF